ncbi:MAG: cytochrome C [Dehalococcoidia bacterium]|nr:cytochrome C [Dehalococcoidia bacterium]
MEQNILRRIVNWLRWNLGFKLSSNMALITGVTMGVLAAVVQGYFGVQPPAGDGICAVSHPADLVNWVVDKVFGTSFVSHEIFIAVPVLTSVGFILGSYAAAMRNKEFKFRRGPVRDHMQAFILGFVIINFGMLWGSCPIRTAVLVSYGMWFAVLILGMMVLGVVAACLYIKWKVRRAN